MSSLQIRLLVEIGDSADVDEVVIRSDTLETFIPPAPETPPEEQARLITAVFDRMSDQAKSVVNEQVQQLGDYVGQINRLIQGIEDDD